MKKHIAQFIASAFFITSASTASAMTFSSFVKDEASATYTKCIWESDSHINQVVLKGKPTRGDDVNIHLWNRHQNKAYKKFVIDAPLQVKSLRILYYGETVAENKKIDIRNDLSMLFDHNASSASHLKLVKSKVDCGLIRFRVWEKLKTIGSAKLSLIDSQINTKGIQYVCDAFELTPKRGRSGIELNLTGASCILNKGELMLDSTLASSPDMSFKIVINEKDGKIPFVSVKNGNISGAELHVNVNGKVKKGIYPLFEVSGTKEIDGSFRGIYLNGKRASLGSTVNVNGVDATIKMGATDKKKDNDFVLEVK